MRELSHRVACGLLRRLVTSPHQTRLTHDTPDGIVLTASTEQLQQLVLEHAEDEEAFSDKYELRPQK